MPVIEKKRSRDLPQINERIRFPAIRLIDSDKTQLGIMPPQEALSIAEEKGLRLTLRFVKLSTMGNINTNKRRKREKIAKGKKPKM
jgi:translation initiation factor IF-3